MTENDLKNMLDNSLNDVKPIIEKMTHLIMDAYEIGFNSGLEIGKFLKNEEGKV